jgi:membrane fusion protein, protease secretion system
MAKLKKVAENADPAGGEAPLPVFNEAKMRKVNEDIGNPGRSIRWGAWLLVLGLIGFLAWAAFAPIDEGVPAPATVMVDTRRQSVQHLTGGIVKEILVREAAQVKAGDVVMRLDDTMARANYEATRKQYMALRVQESRLEAERRGARQIVFHPDIVAERDDPMVAEYIATQRQLFVTRRTALEGQQSILNQTLAATTELLAGYKAQIEGKQAQLKLLREQLEGTRELAKEGYLPRNRLFDEERVAAEVIASIGDLTANMAKTRASLLELQMRVVQVKREFQREVETQLAETTRDAQVAAERYRTAKEELARTEIRSPAEGYVVGLAAHTVGGVIPPGARIMDVVPRGATLTLEARVEPHLVDRVHAELPADIWINAFVDQPNLVIEGRVLSVSADLLGGDQPNNPPYYLARVAVTEQGMKDLGRRQLQPGMPAEVVIKTGERTLINYLFKPMMRRIATSFREA